MNKKLLLFILLGGMVSFPLTCLSQQNLVLNGNLEIKKKCPLNNNNINDAIGWWEFDVIGSPDYFNTCALYPETQIPNGIGYQLPHSENGMIHSLMLLANPTRKFFVVNFNNNQFREAFGGSFTQPLEAGIYSFSCYVNYANFGTYQSDSTGEDGRVATNAFDLLLLKDSSKVYSATPPTIDLTKVISLNDTKILNDTANWVKLTTCFQAEGGELFFALGTFRDTAEIQLEFSGYNNTYYLSTYYFDDFSVEACPSCCEGQFEIFENITISNNPSSQIEFTPHFLAGSYAYLYIYDSAGRLVEKHHLSDKTPLFFGKNRAEGMYHFRYETGNGNVQFGKIIVNQP